MDNDDLYLREWWEWQAELARRTSAQPILLALPPAAEPGIVFGTDIFSGEVVRLPVAVIPHLLVIGISGFGKSLFLHQLASQLVRRTDIERVFLVDLKAGVEFRQYEDRGAIVRVVWRFDDVVSSVASLIDLMEQRFQEMVKRRVRTFPGPRVFFIVDEFAQIQLWPAITREERATHDRLLANLNKLSMLGRAAGIVIIAASQRPTLDAMPSEFRTNLGGQICFRAANKLMAASMFGSTDELALDPTRLPRGRCIFYDPTAGETRYLQPHVAPEAIG